MKVIVQQLARKLYLSKSGEWTAARSEAAGFNAVVDALMFCIQCHEREVKLVGQNEAGEEAYLYPFGGDPVVPAGIEEVAQERQGEPTIENGTEIRSSPA